MAGLSVGVIESGGRARFAVTDPASFLASARTLTAIAGEAGLGADGAAALRAAVSDGKLPSPLEQHEAVCDFLDVVAMMARQGAGPETQLYVQKSAEFDGYLSEKASGADANPRASWRAEGIASRDNGLLGIVAGEIVSHIGAFANSGARYHGMVAHTERKLAETLPKVIRDMQQEANLGLIYPFFEKSLVVPGDACEFGCFRGILSVKLAWFLKALGTDKHYYTFDTFEGFEIADPGGGALGVGAFRDDEFGAFEFLTRWSKVLPLTPVKGDATKTASVLKKPLSFVWLDLDMGVLMDPVLRQIWPLLSRDTVIGCDDVGRPETPTVKPWLDGLVAAGALEVTFDSDAIAPNTFIRFLRKTSETLPPGPS